MLAHTESHTTHGREHPQAPFTIRKAIIDLSNGVPASAVFPGFSGKLTSGDLTTSYTRYHVFPHDTAKKRIVSTLRTAAALDVTRELDHRPISSLNPPASSLLRTSVITPECVDAPNFDAPETPISKAVKEVAADTSQVIQHIVTADLQPLILHRILTPLQGFFEPALAEDTALQRSLIVERFFGNIPTAEDTLPVFFRIITDTYHDHIPTIDPSSSPHYPDFSTFWSTLRSSALVLMGPNVHDIKSFHNFLNRVYTYTPEGKYRINTSLFRLRQKDGVLQVLFSDLGKVLLKSRTIASRTPDDSAKGCPAGITIDLDDAAEIDLIRVMINRVERTVQTAA